MNGMDRRRFLQLATTSALASSAMSVPHFSARAANTSGYKAMVCLFFLGGMDQNDTVLPFDQASYNDLANARRELFNAYGVGSGNSSRDRQNLLALSPDNSATLGGRRLALPRELAPLKSLFDIGDLALVGGVGPLIEPVNRTSFENRSVRVPLRLFSHNDQQSTWQTFGPEGTTVGWGGRFIDAILRSATSMDERFAAITAAENAPFLNGDRVGSFNVSGDGGGGLNVLNFNYFLGFGSQIDQARASMMQLFERRNYAARNILQRDYGNIQGNNIALSNEFQRMFNGASLSTVFPDTELGRQLRSIANTISIRGTIGANRQIFYASQGGFDTHSDQTQSIPRLHENVAQAVTAFRNAMLELGVWDDVVLFSAADFGRTLIDNGDGTDHGWGGHHFVTGGSVVGKNIYGEFARADLNGQRFTENGGRLIPSVSVEQYAATLGRWFGLTDSELSTALPNLNNFVVKNLGFMQSGSGAASTRRARITSVISPPDKPNPLPPTSSGNRGMLGPTGSNNGRN